MIEIGIIKDTPVNKIIDIRDKNQVIKAKYAIGKDDILKYALMAEHYIEISFELNRNALLKRSDYIEWEGDKYTLRNDYHPEQINKRKYKYTLKFEAIEMFFKDIQFYYLNQGLKESEWRLTGNPRYFFQIGIDNINRYFGTTDFKLGTVEPTEIIDITFDVNTNTFDAFTQTAEKCNAEWYMTGKTLHLLNKVSFGDEVDFETDVSVLSMKREEGESTTRYTRILALGSTRNIPYNYRETTSNEAVDAVYPKRLRIPASKGDVIDAFPNMSPDEVVEGTVIFDEVYPRREGTIEAVGTIEYTDTNTDTGEVTKWNAFKIKDSGINFKKEYLLPGQELKLQFTSGDMNGRDFALIFHEKGFSKTDNSQFYEIVRTDEFGKLLPNDVMKPKAGDKYVLYGFNIALVSDQYVPAGEQELYDVATAWQQKQLRDTGVYECKAIIKYFMDNNMDLSIGQKVRLIKDVGSSRNYFHKNQPIKQLTPTINIENRDNNGFTIVAGTQSTPGGSCRIAYPITSNGWWTFSGYIKSNGGQGNIIVDFCERGANKTIAYNATEWIKFEVKAHVDNYNAVSHHFVDLDFEKKWIRLFFKDVKIEKGEKSTDWTPALEDIEDAIRSSRIMGFEKKLNNKFDAAYTVGDNSTYSRFGKIEQQIKELQIAGVMHQATGDNGVYVIKQFDSTRPTDFNVYSAIASDAKYFNKQTGGTVQGDTTFAKNMQVQGTTISDVFQNSTFTAGQLGSGFQIKRDANGQSYIEVDNLLVRRETVFNRLTIAEIKSIGGTILLSLANMVLSKVEVKTSTWKCFFDTANGTIPNDFAVGDQAICRKYTGKDIKYYWALVTAVGADYIELSKTDKDGNNIPSIGDEVVQLGNRSDVNRQYAIMLSAYGSDAPSIKQYAGINSFDLTNKEVTVISPKGNKFKGSFEISTNGTTSPVYKDRGTFVNGTVYYLNDRVSYLGSYWLCIVNTTITTPNETSSTWRKETTGQTDINNAIDGIQLGGRNYMKNSNKFNLVYLYGAVGTATTNYTVSEWGVNDATRVTTSGGTSSIKAVVVVDTPADGLVVTSSIFVKNLSTKNLIVGSNQGGRSISVLPNEAKRVVFEGIVGNNYGSLQFQFRGEIGDSLDFAIMRLKYERGNKVTDWTPAPEDVQADINQVRTDYKADFIVLDTKIAAKVSQTDFDKLGNRVSITESDVTQLSNKITSVVETVDNIKIDVNNAQTTANSRNRTYYQDDKPSVPSGGHTVGDLWYKESLVDSSGNINADTTKNLYQLQYRWDGSDWKQINWSVAKSKIEQTDSNINMMVEKTGINSVGTGSSLFSMINQTADEIRLEVSKISVGGRNYFRENQEIRTAVGSVVVENRDNNGFTVLIGTSTQAGGIARIPNVIKSNGWWTFSGYVKGNATGGFRPDICDKPTNNLISYNTTDWTRFECSVEVTNFSEAVYNFIDLNFESKWYRLFFKDVMIEKGNKATDWTPAPEDVQAGIDNASTAASNAQSTANEAKTAAQTANTLLSDIANDNKLDASEKQSTKKEWDVIIGEYQKNLDLAKKYDVLSINYTTYYTNLSNYLTPLLSNLNITSNITGTEFRSKFKAYYDSRTDLLNAISVKAKEIADSKASLDEVKAGITINTDGITAFGKQFKVDTDLIAKSISTKKLEVGEEGNPKFTVETDGTLSAVNANISGRLAIPFKVVDQFPQGSIINLEDSFNIVTGSVGTTTTIYLPADLKYNGVTCYIFNKGNTSINKEVIISTLGGEAIIIPGTPPLGKFSISIATMSLGIFTAIKRHTSSTEVTWLCTNYHVANSGLS